MNKICTTIEQSKKLIKLGIDVNTVDMYYQYDYYIKEYEEDAQIIPKSELGQHFSLFPEDIPAWSLSALLGLMPKFTLERNISTNEKFLLYYNYNQTYYDDPVDAAFEMVCWLKKYNKI